MIKTLFIKGFNNYITKEENHQVYGQYGRENTGGSVLRLQRKKPPQRVVIPSVVHDRIYTLLDQASDKA